MFQHRDVGTRPTGALLSSALIEEQRVALVDETHDLGIALEHALRLVPCGEVDEILRDDPALRVEALPG
jgi:hypothetical protein